MDTTGTPTQFGPEPNPGLAILSDPGTFPDGREFGSLCTLGPAIRDDAGDREGFVTSKNCPPGKSRPAGDESRLPARALQSRLQWLQTAAIVDGNDGVQIEIEIGDAGLDPDEEAKLHAQFRAGKEY
jgi:hypothetical protein